MMTMTMRETILRAAVCAVLAAAPAAAPADEYMEVTTARCHERTDSAEYRAAVDIPVTGTGCVVGAARRWICDALDIDAPSDLDKADFATLLQEAARQFLSDAGSTSRSVEITWMYEDPTCVTFTSRVTDRDSVTWTTDDVATFSKADGHRVTFGEVFSCDEAKVRQLMWQARGDLRMDAASPAGLYVGNVGYADGWVLVVGPAHDSGGALFRLRYEQTEPWLWKSFDGGYLRLSRK